MRSIIRYSFTLFLLFAILKEIPAQGVFQLWGTTPAGGSSGVGNIYSTDSAGNNFRNRFSIPAINHGRDPYLSKLVKLNGIYYGSTEGVPSVIFAWDPVTNIYTKKIDLEAYGAWSNGSLAIWNNKLYGLLAESENRGNGGIFEWDPTTNIFRIRQYFTTATGLHPEGGLVLFENKFYSFATGNILEWDPATNVLVVKKQFVGGDNDMLLVGERFYGIDGGSIFQWDPRTNGLIIKATMNFTTPGMSQNLSFANGKLYGTTRSLIFELDTLTNVLTQRINLPIGEFFSSGLTWANGKFYGACGNVSIPSQSVIFEWDPIGNILVKKLDISGLVGGYPASLTLDPSGKMIGLTGGQNLETLSTIFEYDPLANTAVLKIEMNKDFGNGVYPNGDLAYFHGAFYGMTTAGGLNYNGIIFEWKPGMSGFTRKKNFEDMGLYMSNGFAVKDDKLYGGGLTWDPMSDLVVYNNAHIIYSLTGKDLILYNQKFYGINSSSLFEWDPATSVVTNKVNLDIQRGDPEPLKISLSLCNGKFYVVFADWEDHPEGLIYEWDPVTNVYALKYSMQQAEGTRPIGSLVEFNGLLYGMAAEGGANNAGTVFSFDPVNNTYTKRFDMTDATGALSKGQLTLSGSKLYGITRDGGLYNKGVVFEFDPVTNEYTVKHHFNGTDGSSPSNNSLVRVPAPVSSGTPGSCTAPLSVLIDNTNHNDWVPLVDYNGDVVAELNPHGNNLGIVNYQVYVHDGPAREDALGRLYLARNLTITPTTQPSSPVDVRLYITEAEFQALRTATNSQGQPSGINTINDLGFFKNGSSCSAAIQSTATLLPATAEVYDGGYILTASVSSFSSFYFTTKTVIALPLTLLSFEGKETGEDVLLNWRTSQEIQTKDFSVEKSIDGINFLPIGSIAAGANSGIYSFTDKQALTGASARLLYRLKMQDRDGRFTYSPLVIINVGQHGNHLTIYPNPVNDQASLQLQLTSNEKLQLKIIDNSGRIVYRQTIRASAGNSSISLPMNKLAAGTYWITLKGDGFDKKTSVIKH